MSQPIWSKHEQNLSSDDPELALKAGDAFDKTRAREMKTSEAARSWEEGRKKEWANNKPEYVRKRMQTERDMSKKTIDKLLDAGSFNTGIIPSPGFILLKLDELPTQMGNIHLPNSNDDAPNTGTVIEVGEDNDNKFAHKKGDRVIIRKYSANLHANVEGQKLFFLEFKDVLGRFKS